MESFFRFFKMQKDSLLIGVRSFGQKRCPERLLRAFKMFIFKFYSASASECRT